MEQQRTLTWQAAIFCLLLALGLAGLAWWLGEDGRDAITQRQARDRVVRVIDHVQSTTWWVAVVGSGLMLGAAVTARFWAGPRAPRSSLDPPTIGAPRWQWWLAAAAILLVAAWLRAERLGLSVYNDEAYMFRRYIAGELRPDRTNDGQSLRVPDWVTTVWHMEVGNNSPPYSILARLSHEQFARHRGLAPLEIDEAALRAPAYVAGLAGLLVLALVARGMGSPDRGLLITLIAALHPWMIRYASEGRGHSLLLLLVPLLLGAIWRALRVGTWRWWLMVGLVSALMMWSFPGAIHSLLGLNAVLASGWALNWLRRRDQRSLVQVQATRWFFANSLAALIFLLLFAPVLNQMQDKLSGHDVLSGSPPLSWWAEIGSQLALGMPWRDANPESPVATAVTRSFDSGNPVTWLPLVALGLVSLAVVLGCLWWCQKTRAGWLLAGIGFGTPLLAFGVARLTNTVLHPWYVIAALPPLLILAIGTLGWPQKIVNRVSLLAWLGGCGGVALWLAPVVPTLKHQGEHSLMPMREAVERVRGHVYPHYQQVPQQVELAAFWTELMVYDPHATPTWSVAELQEMETATHESGKPLYVVFAYRSMALKTRPELVDYIESSGRYQLVEQLHGSGHSHFNHLIYLWTGVGKIAEK